MDESHSQAVQASLRHYEAEQDEGLGRRPREHPLGARVEGETARLSRANHDSNRNPVKRKG